MNNHFFHITIATKPHHVLEVLQETKTRKQETLIVLGEEENRTIGWQGNQNFGLKLKLVAEFLQQPHLLPNDIVLFTDAYDVAYHGSQSEVIRRFLSFNKPIVFGSEKYCNPDPHLENEYDSIDMEFPFLNSGMFIGYHWALRQCIDHYQYNDTDDDQRYWTKQYLENRELFALDYENVLFLNTAGINETNISFDIRGIRYLSEHWKHKSHADKKNPLFIHVNGPDKRFIHFCL
jgi:hypothetical protein